MIKKSKKIIVCGGGTGGHLFPAIALCQELLINKVVPVLVTDMRCINYIDAANYHFDVHVIKLSQPKSGIYRKILFCLSLLKNIILLLPMYIMARPAMVIGFGGYPTLPVLILAKIFKIKITLHEQNVMLGDVNKLFANSAVKIASTFPIAEIKDPNQQVLSGTPVRQAFYQYSRNIDTNKVFKILILSGSQGSKFFNNVIPHIIVDVSKKTSKLLHIDHQINDESSSIEVSKLYQEHKISHQIQKFFFNVEEKFFTNNIIISRAGGSTIAEIIHSGITAILIPFIYAKNNHQVFNAKTLQDNSCGWYFEEQDIAINHQILTNKIIELINNPEILVDVSRRLSLFQNESAKTLSNTIIKLL